MVYITMTFSMIIFTKLAEIMKHYKKNEIVHKKKSILYFFEKLFRFTAFFSPLLVASIRYNVGTDYEVYLEKQIPQVISGYYENVEYLYRQLIHIGNYIGSYQIIFFLTHLILLIFIYKAIYDESKIPVLSILIFVIGGFFN